MIDVINAKCHSQALYAECYCAECHSAECRYTERHGALSRKKVFMYN
jgi:hypothetical protein